MNIELLITITSIIGTISFAISGALIAIENNLDIFGVLMLGATTSVGGGLLRDVFLHRDINIFKEPIYLLISIIVSLIVFIILYFIKHTDFTNSKRYKIISNIIDSIGLGAFLVVGANIILEHQHYTMLEVCFYACLTAVGGGLLRDIFVMKVPAIFRKHIYAVAAILTSIFFYILYINNVNYILNVILTILLVVLIRFLAYHFELSLPKIKLKNK